MCAKHWMHKNEIRLDVFIALTLTVLVLCCRGRLSSLKLWLAYQWSGWAIGHTHHSRQYSTVLHACVCVCVCCVIGMAIHTDSPLTGAYSWFHIKTQHLRLNGNVELNSWSIKINNLLLYCDCFFFVFINCAIQTRWIYLLYLRQTVHSFVLHTLLCICIPRIRN